MQITPLVPPPPDSTTENNAKCYSSSGSPGLDFFANICRSEKKLTQDVEEKIVKLLPLMWDENPLYCLKLIFFKRDCRGGSSEKRIFEVCYNWLIDNQLSTAMCNLEHIPFYGSFMDWTKLHKSTSNDQIRKTIVQLFKSQLDEDITNMQSNKSISLAAKWVPSVNSPQHRLLARALSLAFFDNRNWEKPYRKLIGSLRTHLNITEKMMCENRWNHIDFSKVPSLCMQRNKKTFSKNDTDRFTEYISSLCAGTTKVNVSQLLPHQLVEELETKQLRCDDENQFNMIEEQWKALVENTKKVLTESKMLVISDLSGSMYGLPMTVSKAMGCLFSQISSGPFKDLIITFSENPTFFELKGQTLKERLESLKHSNSEGFNTDLIKVFNILLAQCVRKKVKQCDLPNMILICTDNEFDEQIHGDTNETTYQCIKRKFKSHGYNIPTVVFWNLRGSANAIPVRKEEIGTVMLSGFNPTILKYVMKAEIPDPYSIMMLSINDSRYDRLKLGSSDA